MKLTGQLDKKGKGIMVGSTCFYDDVDIELIIIEEDGVFYAKPIERGFDKEELSTVAKYLRILE